MPTFTGTSGNDTLTGTINQDTLIGGGGDDLMIGHAGDDYFRETHNGREATGNSTMRGGAGNDRITVSWAEAWIEAQGGAGADYISIGFEPEAAGSAALGLIHGGAGNDTIIASVRSSSSAEAQGKGIVIQGGLGNDSITGTRLADTINGGLGVDTMSGGLGNDVYHVTAGDIVTEQEGGGIDTVRTDVSFRLAANVENMVMTGSAHITAQGNTAGNLMQGNGGNNLIEGMGGVDRLFGHGGHDTLNGGAGADTLDGGAGNDALIGGAGSDVLVGGLGADVFVFGATAHIGIGAARDVIADFQHGIDRIDLSQIDANINAAGNQAFGWSGNRAAAHSVWQTGDGAGNTLLRGDVDGDGVQDFALELGNMRDLTASDLIL
ncbi:calcium-binding protein [Paracoccus sp. DMF-8]|uniref:calcium-binding protein n=1 Tax=Paracoccus sp. DMF-8 TaxID=3019445 RepID=UPI0023E83CB9|nr:calcium-binding protein [Paracoccus sp. DMF-8]MDF3605234.1 calcium-binding protein [Paracoccus sp. DMF-8]